MITEPCPAFTMGGTNAWQTSIVPMRLFSVSALLSSSGVPSASLGSGLAPEAPMSPTAQLTRMSAVPSFASFSCFIFATADLSPMLPLAAATLPPCGL